MNGRIFSALGQVRSLAIVRLLQRPLASERRREVLAIAVIVCVFVATFFEAQRIPGGADDCAYFEIAAGQDSGAPHHQQRFGLIGTVKLAQAVFGYTSLAYYSVPFVYTLGLVLACYFAARTFTSVALAVCAALMVLALPTILTQGTWLLVDIPSMVWIVAGVTLFMRALTAGDERLPVRYVVGSGVCLYVAVLTKESTAPLLLGLGCFPLALRSKRSLQILLGTAAVTASLELCEIGAMWAVFGDPLHRLHASTSEQLPYMERALQSGFELPEQVTWGSLATRFLLDMENDASANGWRLLGLGYWDWLVASFFLGLTVAVLRKNQLLLGLCGFVFWSYLSLSLAVVSFDPLTPMVITKPRYFLVVLVWLPVLAVAGWSCLWHWPWERRQREKSAAVIGVAALTLCVAYGTARNFFRQTPYTLRKGYDPITNAYAALTAFTRAGGEVKRIVGPKPLRAAKFLWPEPQIDVYWRPREQGTGHRLRPADLVVAQQPMALQAHPRYLWRSLGETEGDHYFYIERPKSPHPGGDYGMVAATRSHLLRHPKGARLHLNLRFDLHRTTPEPLKVLLHREHREPVVIATFEWMLKGRRALISRTTPVFPTGDAEAVSVEFSMEGPGRFFIEKLDFEVRAKKRSTQP
ncbi:MAG TPA: hypothetical protein VI197_23995 [Polyangiaceae bacterium]